MKKKIIRSSVLVVATMSIMLGGTSYTTSVKDEVRETPVIFGKAIENNVTDSEQIEKGTPVIAESITTEAVEVAEVTEGATEAASEQPVIEEVAEIELEEKEVVLESDQVVANIDSYLNIRSDASEESDVVGKFYRGNVGTIVEKGDEWSLVSSGNAYGYVNNDYLLFGDEAESYIENNCDQIAKVVAETLNVRSEESMDSEVLTLSDEGDSLTILGKENDWIKVAVAEEQVGYVASEYVYIDYVYETAVTIEEEQAAIAAEEAAMAEAAAQEQAAATQQAPSTEAPSTEAPSTEAPSTQASTTETATTEAPKQEAVTTTDVEVTDEDTSKETVEQESGSSNGQSIADYAVQFVGNPYVYGGTSLTNGADCSGFVQSVFKNFGYSLPRVAADQAGAGQKVSTDNLQPGDLLFYHNFGHVAIYIGGGQVVHASNKATGIKISNYNYSPIDKAIRVVQ